jgi:hypothetical protein
VPPSTTNFAVKLRIADGVSLPLYVQFSGFGMIVERLWEMTLVSPQNGEPVEGFSRLFATLTLLYPPTLLPVFFNTL